MNIKYKQYCIIAVIRQVGQIADKIIRKETNNSYDTNTNVSQTL